MLGMIVTAGPAVQSENAVNSNTGPATLGKTLTPLDNTAEPPAAYVHVSKVMPKFVQLAPIYVDKGPATQGAALEINGASKLTKTNE